MGNTKTERMEIMLRAGLRIGASWKSRCFFLLALLGESSLIRRRSVPLAVGEEVLAVDRFDRKYNASGGDGSLLEVGRSQWLHYMRRGMAYGAVRVRQPIRMKVRLLHGSAEEQKADAKHGNKKRLRAPGVRSWRTARIVTEYYISINQHAKL
jgi:hypothetical protein